MTDALQPKPKKSLGPNRMSGAVPAGDDSVAASVPEQPSATEEKPQPEKGGGVSGAKKQGSGQVDGTEQENQSQDQAPSQGVTHSSETHDQSASQPQAPTPLPKQQNTPGFIKTGGNIQDPFEGIDSFSPGSDIPDLLGSENDSSKQKSGGSPEEKKQARRYKKVESRYRRMQFFERNAGNIRRSVYIGGGLIFFIVVFYVGFLIIQAVLPDPDADGDGVPDVEDQCEGFDDTIDADLDGLPDGCDDAIPPIDFNDISFSEPTLLLTSERNYDVVFEVSNANAEWGSDQYALPRESSWKYRRGFEDQDRHILRWPRGE